jgi:hypothetical protein
MIQEDKLTVFDLAGFESSIRGHSVVCGFVYRCLSVRTAQRNSIHVEIEVDDRN